MSSFQYRPWGSLAWTLRHSPQRQWSFLGCVGTEERSITAWKWLSQQMPLTQVRMLRIKDSASRHSAVVASRLSTRLTEFTAHGGNANDVQDFSLFCSHSEIVSAIDNFVATSSSIIIDLTSLPKRFFFPMVRRILTSSQANRVQDFLAVYTIPESYTPEPLAENCNDWAHLPLFSGAYSPSKPEMLAIGVGFQALGLHEQLKGDQGLPIKLLVPFPAPPPAFMRSWDLLRQLQRYGSNDTFQVYRAGARDPSDTFDRLMSLSRNGQQRIALAPFGPKPMSLGMCLFASVVDCEVFYTQPSVYHPDYSVGVSMIEGAPEIYGYCLRMGGKDFYRRGP